MGAARPPAFGTRALCGFLLVVGWAAMAPAVLGQDLGGDFEIEYTAPASGPSNFDPLNATSTFLSLLNDPAIAATVENGTALPAGMIDDLAQALVDVVNATGSGPSLLTNATLVKLSDLTTALAGQSPDLQSQAVSFSSDCYDLITLNPLSSLQFGLCKLFEANLPVRKSPRPFRPLPPPPPRPTVIYSSVYDNCTPTQKQKLESGFRAVFDKVLPAMHTEVSKWIGCSTTTSMRTGQKTSKGCPALNSAVVMAFGYYESEFTGQQIYTRVAQALQEMMEGTTVGNEPKVETCMPKTYPRSDVQKVQGAAFIPMPSEPYKYFAFGATFFGQTFSGPLGQPTLVGTLVHELSHGYAATRDIMYYDPNDTTNKYMTYVNTKPPNPKGPPNENGDSYRVFAQLLNPPV